MLSGILLAGCQMETDSGDVSEKRGEEAGDSQSSYADNLQQPEGEVLQVCVDSVLKEPARSLLGTYERIHEGIRTELIVIPSDEAQAEARITQIRTELMAGEGPDVFLVQSPDPAWAEPTPVLFDNPEKMLYSQIFLPLDSYMAQTQYMDVGDMNETILEAGRTEEGQLILPVYYQYYVSALQSKGLEEPLPETWEEWMTCTDEAAVGETSSLLNMHFYDVFGKIADYETEKLLISEETLLSRIQESVAHQYKGWKTQWDSEKVIRNRLSEHFFDSVRQDEEEEHSFMAIPNEDGGITASITMYTAINANTQQPDCAFALLDLLFSEEIVSQEGFVYEEGGIERYYGNLISFPVGGIPLSDSLFETKCSRLSEADKEAMQTLQARIDAVRFYSTFDSELQKLYEKCIQIQDETELENAVSQTYDMMRMTLAE